MIEEEILKVPSCAEFLNLSESTIRKYIKDDSIPFRKKNGVIYFLKSEIIDWLKDE